MKLKSILFSLAAFGGILLTASCGGSSETTIKNEKLHPFLLSGVYTLEGYGGGSSFYPYLKQFVTAEPGSSKFLNQMSEAFEGAFVLPFDPADKSHYIEGLNDWWGVGSKSDFLETQENLITSGHQASYEKVRKALEENGGATTDLTVIDLAKYGLDNDEDAMVDLRFVRDNYDKFSKSGIKAWDIVRYVNNVNMGCAAGYISEDEGVEMAKKALVEAQKHYDSWEDYFNDWNLGRGFWGGDNSDEFNQAIRDLLDKENAYNIYNYVTIK